MPGPPSLSVPGPAPPMAPESRRWSVRGGSVGSAQITSSGLDPGPGAFASPHAPATAAPGAASGGDAAATIPRDGSALPTSTGVAGVGEGVAAPAGDPGPGAQAGAEAGGGGGMFGTIVLVSRQVFTNVRRYHRIWTEQWAPSGVGGWDFHRREMRMETGAAELHLRRPDGAVIDCMLLPALPAAPRMP